MAEPTGDPLLAGLAAGRDDAFAALFARDGPAWPAGARALALVPPSPADAPNAAPIYRAAFAALTPQDQLPDLLRDRAQVWRQYDRTAFDPADREQREFLESQQRGLALLRQAAATS